jgi:hypothetical protein
LTARHRDVARYRGDAAVAAALLQGHARGAEELLGSRIEASLLASRVVEGLAAAFGVTLHEAGFAAVGLPDPEVPK